MLLGDALDISPLASHANNAGILGASIAASRLFPGKIMNTCTHRGAMREVPPKSSGCEDCLKQGDSWVQLRMCLTCGNVGCCDSSKNKHATAHFDASGHPVMRSLHPGDSWKWCYVDRVMLE